MSDGSDDNTTQVRRILTAKTIAEELGGARTAGDGYMCCCPAHGDTRPSLWVHVRSTGQLLVKCHAGCENDDVIAALRERDLIPTRRGRHAAWEEDFLLEETYRYTQADGTYCFTKERRRNRRTGEKTFRCIVERPGQEPRRSISGVPKPIFRAWPVYRTEDTVVLVEGEKDVLTLEAEGFVATTHYEGASGRWSEEQIHTLRGKDLVIIPDNDEPSKVWANRSCRQLLPHVRRLRYVELPDVARKGDVSDWMYLFEKTGDDLRELIENHALEIKSPEDLPDLDWREHLFTTRGDNPVAKSTVTNVQIALDLAPELQDRFALDTFGQRALIVKPLPWDAEDAVLPREVDWNLDPIKLGVWLGREADMHGVSVTNCCDGIKAAMAANKFDSLEDYLMNELPRWDGAARLETWLQDYCGAAENPKYLALVGRKFLISGIARALATEAPVAADSMLVLESWQQGVGKSRLCQALALREDLLAVGPPLQREAKDLGEILQGKWIAEVEEMAAARKAETDHLKAQISRRVDRYRASYERAAQDYPRRCVLIGTINLRGEGAHLRDSTGNRRFWCVEIDRVDIDRLTSDAPQLWAEALQAYRSGEAWWIEDDAEAALVNSVIDSRYGKSEIEEQLTEYIHNRWDPLLEQWTPRETALDRMWPKDFLHEVNGIAGARTLDTLGRRLMTETSTALARLGWRKARDKVRDLNVTDRGKQLRKGAWLAPWYGPDLVPPVVPPGSPFGGFGSPKFGAENEIRHECDHSPDGGECAETQPEVGVQCTKRGTREPKGEPTEVGKGAVAEGLSKSGSLVPLKSHKLLEKEKKPEMDQGISGNFRKSIDFIENRGNQGTTPADADFSGAAASVADEQQSGVADEQQLELEMPTWVEFATDQGTASCQTGADHPARLAGTAAIQEILRSAAVVAFDFETTALSPSQGGVRLCSLSDGEKWCVVDVPALGDGEWKLGLRRLWMGEASGPGLEATRGLGVGLGGCASLVVFNAAFERRWLEECDHVHRPADGIHDAMLLMQAAFGGSWSLEDSVKSVLGEQMDKQWQTYDWSLPELEPAAIKYAGADAALTWRLWAALGSSVDEGVQLGYLTYLRALPAVQEACRVGIPISRQAHSVWLGLQRERVAEYAATLKSLAPDVENWGAPSQRAVWLEEALPPEVLTQWPKTDRTKRYQFDDKIVSRMRSMVSGDARTVLEAYLLWREAETQISRYGDSLADLISEDGRLRSSLKIGVAITGRMSSSGPNLQQMPRGAAFRSLFVAPEGRTLVVADYSQIEVRVGAMLAGQLDLFDKLQAGYDIHVAMASVLFNCSVSEVTPEMRSQSKAITFGIQYGMSAPGLAAVLKCSVEEAQAQLDRWAGTFPKMAKQRSVWHAESEHCGYLSTVSGRRIHTGRHTRFSVAANYPVQGSAADVIYAALDRLVELRGQEGVPFDICLQVHDELLLECDVDRAEEVKEILETAMIEGYRQMFPAGNTTGLVDAKIVKAWGEAK